MNRKFLLDRLAATLHLLVIYNFKFHVSTLDGHEVFAAIDIYDLALSLLVTTCYDLNEVSFNDVPSCYWFLGYFVGKHSLCSLNHGGGFEASKIL